MYNRTYFVVFKLGIDGTLVYGATIKRYPGPITRISSDTAKSHILTASNRMDRFPVETKITLPDSVKTRGDLKKYIETKKFKKTLIKKFTRLGVRHRNGKGVSLKDAEFNHKFCLIKKNKNRAYSNYYDNINHFKKLHENDKYDERNDNIDWENHKTFESIIHKDGRVFHFTYKRDSDSQKIMYGASVFRPENDDDWQYYNEDEHFWTSRVRMEQYPVFAKLESEHTYNTRLASTGEIQFIKKTTATKMRKLAAKYGVRNRKGERFLTPHLENTKCLAFIKKSNRKMFKLQKEYKDWKQRSEKERNSIKA